MWRENAGGVVLPVRRVARRWMWWVGGVIGVVVLMAYAAAFLSDEPLRRYVERQVNVRLKGYSVRIQGLSIHPLSGSFDLRGATIFQNANADPPIAQVDRLRTTVDWHALLDGRVVADLMFERPKVHLDLTKIRTEAAGDVALTDRGWQRALEAVALDLKINRLRLVDGDVTYVDDGPFKPLRVSRLDATAENIRNIRSRDRTYPSEIRAEGVIFETGRLSLDGHADFLAEPHPGIELTQFRLEDVDLDYFRPVTNRVNLSVREGTLTVVGAAEYAPTVKRMVLRRVLVEKPRVDYVHAPQTAEAERTRAAHAVRAAKEVANDPGIALRIDQLDVVGARIGFVNRAATPPYRVVLTDADLSMTNLSNQRVEGTAAVKLNGKIMGTGDTRVSAHFRPETRSGDLDVKVEVKDVALERIRDLVRAHGGQDVSAGRLSLYAEIRVKSGEIEGYVKPMLRDVLAQGDLMNLVARLLENRVRGEIATVVTLSGRADRPDVSTWEVVRGLLQNAFFRAIRPGFER